MSHIQSRKLDCGATLVLEPIANVRSAAMNWLVPVGSAADPDDGEGYATLLSELLFRGAGGLDSRAHSDALDRLGVQRSSDVFTHHMRLKATVIGENLPGTLPLLADMIRRPALREDALEPVRRLCLSSLESLVDDPQHLVVLQLRGQHAPPPLNRHGYGDRQVLAGATIDQLRAHWAARCVPVGTIIAVAGAIEPDALTDQFNRLLEGWTGEADEVTATASAARGYQHTPQQTAQMHLAAAYDAPPEKDESSVLERLGTSVLSGSTSARLFTEVRQKRSLCYSVGASYRSNRDTGMVALYAGTTPERAQETLDVSLGEIRRLREGVERDEFCRAATGLKSHLVMSGESTTARAAALASDQFRLGRPRTLEEITQRIDRVTLDDLNGYLSQRTIDEFTICSIGPNELDVVSRPAEAHAPARQ